jgi:hypothetical protein
MFQLTQLIESLKVQKEHLLNQVGASDYTWFLWERVIEQDDVSDTEDEETDRYYEQAYEDVDF